MVTEEENLIKEVDEEIKQDDYKRLWKKYGKYLISSFILIILLVSLGTTYKNYKIKKTEELSQLYFNALEKIENEDYVEAEKILTEIYNAKGGYSDLSVLQQFYLNNKQNKDHNIKNDKLNKNIFLKDYFILQIFNKNLSLEKNNISIDEIVRISRPNSPWRFTAHELLTSYYLKNNDTNNAIQSLNAIIEDESSPISMKERALLILKSLKNS